MYYRNSATSDSSYAMLNPKFYPFLFLRLLIVSVNFFRADKKYIHPNQNGLSGLKHFIDPTYEPLFYHELLGDSELKFHQSPDPVVSIFVTGDYALEGIKTCLKSLLLHTSSRYAYEVILVGNSDKSALANISGILTAENHEAALGISKGKYICLLDNNTIILPNWLESLVETIEADTNVGCVGSKLLYPYGLLQEAGGVITQDAAFISYGENEHPKDYKYDYKRGVDYCKTGSILFRKTDYLEINMPDKKLSDPIYAMVDFCLSMQHTLCKQVLYQPSSILIQSMNNSDEKEEDNCRNVFIDKWGKLISSKYPDQDLDLAAKRHLPKRTITVIDAYLPFFDKESGSNRLLQLLKIFQHLGYHVCYIPNDGKYVKPYYDLLTSKLGITVLHNFLGKSYFKQSINTLASFTDILWICRPKLNLKYRHLVRNHPRLKWIYDTVDLHYVRLFRQAEKEHRPKLERRANKFKGIELKLAAAADASITVTHVEKELLNQEKIKSVYVIPNVHDFNQSEVSPDFDKRKGILFIGGYKHGPNIDAVTWFVKDIMPIVWQKMGAVPVYLLGSYPTHEVLALANENVIVPGYLENVGPYFMNSRVFVAPLRFGAGMKGKIGQSLEYGLPIVSTSIGIEGMNLTDRHSVLIANEAEEFASKVIELYEDENIWHQIKNNSLKSLMDYSPKVVGKNLKNLFGDLSIKN